MANTSSVGIYPGFQEISLRPGEVYQGTFNVINPNPDSSSVVSYKIFSTPFSVSDKNYDVDLETRNDFNQIADWVTFDLAEGSVKGGETVKIPFTINVPEDVPGGGQYATFVVRIADDGNVSENKYAIGTNRQVASILYAKIDGETRQEGIILENKIDGFFFSSPIEGSALIQNSGNIHFSADSYLRVFPLFSNEEIYSSAENPKQNIVLPNTTLSTTNTWEETPGIGIFRVVQTVSYLNNTSSTEKTVFVCPLWFLALWVILICGGAFWIFTNSRARKKAKKRAKNYIGPNISR